MSENVPFVFFQFRIYMNYITFKNNLKDKFSPECKNFLLSVMVDKRS